MTRLGEPGLEGQLPAVQLRTGDLSPVIQARARTAVRCWGLNPGRGRPARICSRRNGVPSMADKEREVRRIWPLPPRKNHPAAASIEDKDDLKSYAIGGDFIIFDRNPLFQNL